VLTFLSQGLFNRGQEEREVPSTKQQVGVVNNNKNDRNKLKNNNQTQKATQQKQHSCPCTGAPSTIK
jgi:hypothetical protein